MNVSVIDKTGVESVTQRYPTQSKFIAFIVLELPDFVVLQLVVTLFEIKRTRV